MCFPAFLIPTLNLMIISREARPRESHLDKRKGKENKSTPDLYPLDAVRAQLETHRECQPILVNDNNDDKKMNIGFVPCDDNK